MGILVIFGRVCYWSIRRQVYFFENLKGFFGLKLIYFIEVRYKFKDLCNIQEIYYVIVEFILKVLMQLENKVEESKLRQLLFRVICNYLGIYFEIFGREKIIKRDLVK